MVIPAVLILRAKPGLGSPGKEAVRLRWRAWRLVLTAQVSPVASGKSLVSPSVLGI